MAKEPRIPLKGESMTIHVVYVAQLKSVRGVEQETLEMDGTPSVREVLDHLAGCNGPELRDMLLTGEGRVRPSLLLFAGDRQVDPESPEPLTDGQTLTLLSPMAGG